MAAKPSRGTTAKRKKSAAPRERGLTEAAIRERVGSRSFQLGQRYFEQGAVSHGRRQGATLKARCEGSSAPYYRVEATVEKGRITQADCSCPVGDGGYCKHTAAVLLHWLSAPDDFHEVEETRTLLAQRSKGELIALIEQMLRREPELESLLELALPAGKRRMPVDPRVYRKQAAAAFRSAGYGWEADAAVTGALESLQQIGDQFRQQGETASAAAVYSGILEGFAEQYETFQDETGNVCVVAQECARGLGQCLETLEESSEAREGALNALFEILDFDIGYGGIGLSDDVPDIVAAHATPQERAVFAERIRSRLAEDRDESASWSGDWQQRTWGGLLLDLEQDHLDDESYLRRCRELGQTDALVARLLKLGRIDEAVDAIRTVSDYQLTSYAELLVERRRADLAESLVRERWDTTEDWRLAEWLERFYAGRKSWQAAFDLRHRQFAKHPNLADYQTLKKYAAKLKTWDAVRPDLMRIIEAQADLSERIRIHLDEGEVDQALVLFNAEPKKRRAGYGYDGASVALELAKAAEKNRPEAALAIYLQRVELLVMQRGRDNYEEACRYLKTVRRLYQQLGREAEWQQCVAGLREENRTLRAFQDELRKAGL